MKLKTIITLTTSLLISFGLSLAQDSDNVQLLAIHEDLVLPSQNSQYLDAGKSLKKALSDNNVQGVGYYSFWLYDNSFIHVREIKNLAELDKNPFSELFDQIGQDGARQLFSKFNGTYHSHRDFVAIFHPEWSYKPELLEEEGNNFREWMYLYYDDKDHEAMVNFIKEWKALYESKGIESGYTVYTAGFGHYGPVMVVHTWGKSRADHARLTEENEAKLGEDAHKLWERTSTIVTKQELKSGYLIEDISYIPQQ